MDVRSRAVVRFVRAEPDPNRLQIMARAAVIRRKWSRSEERRRRAKSCGWRPPDASPEMCRLLAQSQR